MATTLAPVELHNLAHASAMLQRTPRQIEKAAEALELSPVLKLNSIAYYDAEQLTLLSDYFRDIDAKRNS